MNKFDKAYMELGDRLLDSPWKDGIFPYKRIVNHIVDYFEEKWALDGYKGIMCQDIYNIVMNEDPDIFKKKERILNEIAKKYDVMRALLDSKMMIQFRDSIFQPGMGEAILYRVCRKAENYATSPLSDEEDWIGKVDVRTYSKKLGRKILLQIKSRAINHNSKWIQEEKQKQIDYYGIHAQYLRVIFSDNFEMPRYVIWYKDNGQTVTYEFTKTYMRSPQQIKDFVEKFLNPMAEEIDDFYEEKKYEIDDY